MSKDFKLATCIDFYDELINTWFDEKRLRDYLSLLKSWGYERIYWIYIFKYSDGFLDHNRIPQVSENARKSYEAVGELTPAVCRIAHELGMEFYCVFKPIDFGFYAIYPYDHENAAKYGKINCIGGTSYWAVNDLVRLQKYRIKRHPADIIPDIAKRKIGKIRLASSNLYQPVFEKDTLKIYVSNNNGKDYVEYGADYSFRHEQVGGERVVWLEGLDIAEPYMALHADLPFYRELFGNRLDRLVKVYDTDGNELPFSYGLRKIVGSWCGENSTALSDGFLFDDLNSGTFENCLETTEFAIDNPELNCIGIAKGKEEYARFFLSAAYEEVRNCWLGHIKEILDIGVDGVDLRVPGHSRSLDWNRYGFEDPVVEKYKEMYGVDITCEEFDEEKRLKVRAEFYNQFYREASSLIRSYGKKAQVHIGQNVRESTKGKRYMGQLWDWQSWLSEDLFDEITLKDGPWACVDDWRAVLDIASEKGLPTYYTPYWKGLAWRKNWPEKFYNEICKAKENGVSGLTVYETAMYLKMDDDGQIENRYPDLPEVLKKIN